MTAPYYADDHVTLYLGDCRAVLAGLPDSSIDSIVTDPPYELGFMGKAWDGSGIAYDAAMWSECLRVLKPGGHLLAFGGTRTYHRMTVAIEDAGFEIRDSIHWIYGSGFPKSLDVSKAIDKAAGAERRVVGKTARQPGGMHRGILNAEPDITGSHIWSGDSSAITAPATPEAAQWSGWGTALKPAHEPIVVARKPLVGTVAANVLAHGTGALNIDACRIGTDGGAGRYLDAEGDTGTVTAFGNGLNGAKLRGVTSQGRWPANVIFDEHTAPALDAQSGMSKSSEATTAKPMQRQDNEVFGKGLGSIGPETTYTDTGGASRFFPVFRYEAKAPTFERPRVDGMAHSTVKPLDLMRWLVRLVTPPGGTVLDPFAGSGTTAEACVVEGFNCIAIELDPGHLPLIEARIRKPIQPVLDFGDTA